MSDVLAPGSRETLAARVLGVGVLVYFALHAFRPGPAGIANTALVLAALAGIWTLLRSPGATGQLRGAVLAAWLGFVVVAALSLTQAPPEIVSAGAREFGTRVAKGTLGGMLLALWFDDARKARFVLMAGVIASLVITSYFVVSTVRGVTAGALPFQRDYAFYLMPFLPFVLAYAVSGERFRWVALALALMPLAISVGFGFRGGLLAYAVILMFFAPQLNLRRLVVPTMLLVALTLAAVYVVAPGRFAYVVMKFQQADLGDRVYQVWLPALDMFLRHPWLGNGFGHAVYTYQYELLRPEFPLWNRPTAGSPHNIWLEVAFTTGIAGLAVFALFAISYLVQSLRNARALAVLSRNDPMRLLATALLASFVGSYLVLSFFESPNWTTLALLAGLMQGVTASTARTLAAENPKA
jgi:O-antigen ligase